MLREGLAKVFKQSGVIPYRITDGKVEILLITSSSGKRWIIPKGFVEYFMSAADSAAKEALEEAGVIGSVVTPAIGSYSYRKWKYRWWGLSCHVEVFLMRVETVLDDWAEANKRQRQWLSVSEASKRIKEPALKQMIQGLNSIA